jgi:hypothetical protein
MMGNIMSVNEIQKEIINNLTSDNSELKREAITELIDQPLDDEIMSMLTECLTDPDKGIRDAASVTLMHNGNPFIPGFAAPLIISPDISVRNSAGEILITIGENAFGKYTLGVIMTGMGRDGAEAIKELKSIGGYVLAQDEESCVVYGMPKAVVVAGNADVVAGLESIPLIINKAFIR